MTTTQEFNEMLKSAQELPTHINNELQPHYVFFTENHNFNAILTTGCTPANVLRALGKNKGYYPKLVQTYRPDGTIKPKSEWNEVVMYHKKWARTDTIINNVSFDVVGIKRKTTHLDAGVLVTNVKFS